MAKPPFYEPIIINLLRTADAGITTSELAEKADCSRQQVYKILSKPRLKENVEVIGTAATGAQLLAWKSGREQARVGGEGDRPLTMSAIFHVVRMEKVDDHIHVVLQDDDGHQMEGDVPVE